MAHETWSNTGPTSAVYSRAQCISDHFPQCWRGRAPGPTLKLLPRARPPQLTSLVGDSFREGPDDRLRQRLLGVLFFLFPPASARMCLVCRPRINTASKVLHMVLASLSSLVTIVSKDTYRLCNDFTVPTSFFLMTSAVPDRTRAFRRSYGNPWNVTLPVTKYVHTHVCIHECMCLYSKLAHFIIIENKDRA